MNTIKKLATAHLISAGVIMGIAGVFPVLAQTMPPSREEALQRMRQSQTELEQRRERWQTARVEDRDRRRREYRDERLEHARRIIDLLMRREYDIRQRVIDNRRIYLQHEEAIRFEADEELLLLRQYMTRLEAAREDDGQFLTIIGEIRARQERHNIEVRKRVLIAHIEGYNQRIPRTLDTTSQRLTTLLNQLEQEGRNVADLKKDLADANAKIALVKSALVTLQHTVETQPVTPEMLVLVRTEMQSIQANVDEVYVLFRKITQQITIR